MRHSRAAVGFFRQRGPGAFTLIELLTVITIILILAGLILAVAGYANSNAGAQRAKAEIQAMSLALENFKTDNGAYPRATPTDALDPRANFDPGGPAVGGATYTNSSLVLYQYLSGQFYLDPASPNSTPQPWASGTPAPLPKYYRFNNNQLKASSTPAPNGYLNPATVQSVIDPFGLSYGYSTAYQADLETNAATSPPVTTPPKRGYNPGFDLWSTAGYGTNGKAYSPSPSANSSPPPSALWIKNW